ncbi:MAG: potassium channel family protein, partial [Nitrospinaceae bacterium]|nr:potassium channel family protein [Nitrospinaceae bacterium]
MAVLLIGSFGFMMVEKISLADAFYFCIVTVSSVGYGDIHPATQAGKMLAVFVIVMGVGTFLGVIANAIEMLMVCRETELRLNKLNMVRGL